MVLVYILAGIGLALFLGNVYMAVTGAQAQRKMRREHEEHQGQMSALQAAEQRLESLRQALKERFGSRYSDVVKPVDGEASMAISALLRSDTSMAIRHLNAASDAAQQLLDEQATV